MRVLSDDDRDPRPRLRKRDPGALGVGRVPVSTDTFGRVT